MFRPSMIHIHPRHCRFSHILIFRLIYKLLDVIMRCISKPFHTCSCFAFVISNIVWLIWFECFDVNTEGSCLRVSRENPYIHFLFNQKCCCDSTSTVGFSWFSGELRDLPLWIFFSYLHCSAMLSYCAPCIDTANIDVLVANQIAGISVAMW